MQQALQLPKPVLPESRHLQVMYTHDMMHCPFYLPMPFLRQLKFPVQVNRMTYQHPVYVSYPDVPAKSSPHGEDLSILLCQNNHVPQAPNTILALHVLWIIQNGHDLLSLDSSDQYSSLQNKDMSICPLRTMIRPGVRNVHDTPRSQYFCAPHSLSSLILLLSC